MKKEIKIAKRPIETAKEGRYKALDIDALGLHNDDLYYRDIGHKSVGCKFGVRARDGYLN